MPYRNDSMNKDGKPADGDQFAQVRRIRERFDALSSLVSDAYADVPTEEGLAEIDAAVARERRS